MPTAHVTKKINTPLLMPKVDDKIAPTNTNEVSTHAQITATLCRTRSIWFEGSIRVTPHELFADVNTNVCLNISAIRAGRLFWGLL